jgi:diguanylate cyclase (GGDEF)-like protein
MENIERHERKEEQLIQISMTDELTRVANRRCYDTDIENHEGKGWKEDFVLLSADVNGLKEANDNRGHVAGDELLIAAAECLNTVIGPIGKVYRTGGDEFLAIVLTDAPEAIVQEIQRLASAWKGTYSENLSMSIGYASHRDHPEADIHSLERLADTMMYQEKNRYYSAPGVDRRRNV